MAKLKIYGAVILIVLMLIVVLQNTEQVETKLLFITITMPRAALLALTLLIGMAVGMLISLGMVNKRSGKTEE
jgi:uncharacterized integral membrane protein